MTDGGPFDSAFARCLVPVLAAEGGYVDDSRDPGGATNQGITQRVYSAWLSRHGRPAQTVKLIKPAEVSEIYYSQYWLSASCQLLPPGINLSVFDTSVNAGCHESALLLQRSLGVRPDGLIGQITLAAAEKANQELLIEQFTTLRLGFLHRLRTWKFFARGWTSRVKEIETRSLQMLMDYESGVMK